MCGGGQGEAVDGCVVAGAGDAADGVGLEGCWVEGFFGF